MAIMNPWHHLGVESTATPAEIKRAYAQKLKVTKPDQKPAQFQALHQAYKAALNLANRRERQEETGVQWEKASDNSVDRLINAAVESSHRNDNDGGEEHAGPSSQGTFNEVRKPDSSTASLADDRNLALEIKLRQEAYQKIIAELERLLQQNAIPADELQWHFLVNTPYILEDDFNNQMGRHVFYLLSSYGQARIRRSRGRYYKRQLPHNVIRYCDQIFSWRNRAYYLAQDFGESFCRLIFSKLDDNYSASNSMQGVRGGTLIHETKSSQAAPTRNTNSTSYYNGHSPFLIILVLVAVFNMLRHCSPAVGQ